MPYETARTPLLRHIGFVGGTIILLLLCSLLLKPSPPAAKARRVSINTPRSPKRLAPRQDTLSDFQKTEFYRTIIDNNLFRPLGWRPPRPREPYRLIGTLLPRDGDTPKQATVQRTTTRRTSTVRIGETLDTDTKVVDIQPKQVTLETNGKQRTLRLNTTPWIK